VWGRPQTRCQQEESTVSEGVSDAIPPSKPDPAARRAAVPVPGPVTEPAVCRISDSSTLIEDKHKTVKGELWYNTKLFIIFSMSMISNLKINLYID